MKTSDFYQKKYKAYHEKTFSIDPSSFLEPLVKKLPAEAFILDVGCGSGRDLLWIKKQGFEGIGFERSLGLAQLARENVGCEVIDGDFETYDFLYFWSMQLYWSVPWYIYPTNGFQRFLKTLHPLYQSMESY